MSTGLQGLPGRDVIVLAEQALLGALLFQPHMLATVSGWLEPEHFYLPHHTALYSAMRHLAKAGHPAFIEKHPSAEDGLAWVQQITALSAEEAPAVTPSYAHTLISSCPQPKHASAYGHMVLADHTRRTVAQHAARLCQAVQEAPGLDAGVDLTCARADELADVLEQLARRWRPHPGSLPRTKVGLTPSPNEDTGDRVHVEQAFLSAVTHQPTKLREVRAYLTVEDFADPVHQQLFRALAALDHRGDPVDPVTVLWEAQYRGAFTRTTTTPQEVLAICEPSGNDPIYWAVRVLGQSLISTAAEVSTRIKALAADATLTPHQLITASRRAHGDLTLIRLRWHRAQSEIAATEPRHQPKPFTADRVSPRLPTQGTTSQSSPPRTPRSPTSPPGSAPVPSGQSPLSAPPSSPHGPSSNPRGRR
ncbi:DnaB-like helicase N-terminal domain-containing protein [Streptomyces abikoensis]|uniref:DnaB-like helicase N-terminal domain-containing protein n=1 Tax=Streptomyces abikoensis TaxID=97398 RepID=UPI00167C1CAE